MKPRPDFYALLGILRTATPQQIRRAYLRAAKRLHPDKNVAPGETELFLDVQKAYEVLSDAARRAEYDSALPPEESKPEPVRLVVEYSCPTLLAQKEAQLVYVLLEVHPVRQEKAEAERSPLNLCLVVDTSTSMAGPKMEVLRSSAIRLLKSLRPKDVFSLVAFSDRAAVILPATREVDTHRSEARIHMLNTGGGTEILQGLEAGLNEVRRYLGPSYINHVILLTDGRTYGDEPGCLELAATAATLGVGISGLGIGGEWNDALLDALSSRTGGSCMHVARPDDIQRLLDLKFNNLSRASAEEALFEFELAPGVALNYAFRLSPESDPLPVESPLHLGAMLHDRELSLVLELAVSPLDHPGRSRALLNGTISLIAPAGALPTAAVPVVLTRKIAREQNPEPPPAKLIQSISRLTLYRMQEKARAEVGAGHFTQAAARLQNLATHLLAQGERGLAHTVLLETEHIQREHAFSAEGDKQIKYGTRALLLSQADGSP